MLASELLRRLVPSGSGSNVNALGAFAATGQLSGFGGLALGTFFSTPVSLAALTSGSIVVVPSIPGRFALSVQASIVCTSGAGTCTTNLIAQTGNDAAESNVNSTTTFSPAAINATIATMASVASARLGLFATAAGASSGKLISLATPVTLKITTASAGTGGYALQGYVVAAVVLAP